MKRFLILTFRFGVWVWSTINLIKMLNCWSNGKESLSKENKGKTVMLTWIFRIKSTQYIQANTTDFITCHAFLVLNFTINQGNAKSKDQLIIDLILEKTAKSIPLYTVTLSALCTLIQLSAHLSIPSSFQAVLCSLTSSSSLVYLVLRVHTWFWFHSFFSLLYPILSCITTAF